MSTDHGQYAQTFHQLDHLENLDFQQLFKAPSAISLTEIIHSAGHFPRSIDPNISEDLTKPISMGELESTLKWFKKDKSRGPYGWSIELYLPSFDTLYMDLLKVVEECRITGHMYEFINFTFIALIPNGSTLWNSQGGTVVTVEKSH